MNPFDPIEALRYVREHIREQSVAEQIHPAYQERVIEVILDKPIPYDIEMEIFKYKMDLDENGLPYSFILGLRKYER